MIHSPARIHLAIALLFAAPAVGAQDPPEGIPKITLKTNPLQVRAGQEFEMIWRVSAKDAQVLEVFVDCADSAGHEHTWKHGGGDGVFESRVTHVEETGGFKEYELWAKLQQGETYRFAGESFQINVEEKDGDEDLAAFLSWLKKAGYSDEIIRIYAHDGTNPLVRQKWDKYFAMRKEELAYRSLETMPIVFVDLLAAEDEATNESLEGQTAELEQYMARIYGKNFKIHYLQQRVSYQSLFGKPILQSNDKGDEWLKFDALKQRRYSREVAARITKERLLPSNAVMIHWAVDSWKHEGDALKIQDLTGSGPANSGMEFNNYGLGIYAHEWGHGLGLGHMFVDGPGSYRSRIWGLECIMNHSYVAYSNREVGRLLSPLLRYVLEPKEGFLDQQSFVATYREAMAETDHLKERLRETRTELTAASTMTWHTPWNPDGEDSVICRGLQNRSYEVQELELHSGIEPGSYSLLVGTSGESKIPRTLVLKRDGQIVASTSVSYRTKISQSDPYTITIKDYLSLVIGKSGPGTSNLFGVGKLINEKPLIVPAKR